MSVPATEGVPTQGAGEEGIELPSTGDLAFGALMDALVSDDAGASTDQAAAEGAPAGGTDQGPASAGAGSDAGAAGAPAGGAQPAAPEAGGPAAPAGAGDAGAAPGEPGGEGAAAGGAEQPAAAAHTGDRPATWTADAAALSPKLGELATKLEENTSKAYQAEALEAVREEHSAYFEALEKHPRLLVGTQVPAIGKEGMETLRDTNDAREWQEAVKSILVAEVQDRAGRQVEESKDYLETVHASIQLFQTNPDLVPGTKDFDVDLANRFATLAQPYELRVEGKLHGYTIPVQPIINQLRTQLQQERAAQPAPVAAPAAGVSPPKPAEPPQAGIPSKAGTSSEKEDFSTLFGTLGLHNFTI